MAQTIDPVFVGAGGSPAGLDPATARWKVKVLFWGVAQRGLIAFVELSPFAKRARHRFLRAS